LKNEGLIIISNLENMQMAKFSMKKVSAAENITDVENGNS